jgi:V8-like Glu-specific endopeptidase
MGRRTVRVIAFVTLVVLMLSVGLTFSVQAQSDDPGAAKNETSVVSKVISKKDQASALSSWTRKAIASAQPMEMPMMTGSAEVDAAASVELDAASATAGYANAGAAAPGALTSARKAYATDWAAISKSATNAPASEELAGTSQVYDYYYLNSNGYLWGLYPHVWVGRLSFNTTGGTSYCSATAISGNVMLTAAHCVFDTAANKWYSGWVFAPAYRNGATPFGTFAASQCWVLTSWVNLSGSFSINGWTKYDVAVCKMGNNSNGQTLNAAVGFMGRQWNYGYVRHFYDMGYPWRNYNNTTISGAGAYLRTCVAESFQQTTDTRGMGCYYGPGISGGPWVARYQVGVASGYADGVNSGLYIGTQNLYSIRFTSSNIVPLCTAAVC